MADSNLAPEKSFVFDFVEPLKMFEIRNQQEKSHFLKVSLTWAMGAYKVL